MHHSYWACGKRTLCSATREAPAVRSPRVTTTEQPPLAIAGENPHAETRAQCSQELIHQILKPGPSAQASKDCYKKWQNTLSVAFLAVFIFLCFFFLFLILFYFLTLQYCIVPGAGILHIECILHIAYWVQHFPHIGFAVYQNESTTGIHVFPILNPPPSSLPVPSLWVVPVHQPQASSIVHRTWTGNSFHIWYYTCFNAIHPNHPSLSLSHRDQKIVLYISVSFAVLYTGLLLPSF